MSRMLVGLLGLALLCLSLSACTLRTRIRLSQDSSSLLATKITVSDTSATEGQNLVFTVNLDKAATSNVVFTWATLGSGTATSGSDFTPQSGTVTITAGASQASLTVPTLQDSLYEQTETVEIAINPIQGADLKASLASGIPGRAVGQILDDDTPPVIEFSSASQSVSEAVGNATIPVQLSTVSGTSASVAYTVSGTASGSGIDYTLANGTLTIAAGQSTADLIFPIVDDALTESTETVIVTLTSPTGASLGSTTVHTLSIVDNDNGLPTLNWSTSSQTVAESVGTVTLTASLSTSSSQDVTVPITVSGTSSAADHNAADSTLTITAGSTSVQYTFTVTDDSLYENSETVQFAMGTPTNANLGLMTTHLVTITDDDTAPTVNWTSSTQTVSEGAGTLTITAQLSTASGLPVTIPLTISGTATGGGTDYVTPPSSLTIPAGATTASLVITLVNDTVVESTETVILTMGTVTGATKGPTTVHTANIADDDYSLSISGGTVAETAGSMTLTVFADHTAGQDIAFNFATSDGTALAGSDYTAQSGTATILSGSSSTTIAVPITNDLTSCEGDETFGVTISAPSVGTLSASNATVTITDDDNPTLTMNSIYLVPGANAEFAPTLSSTCSTDLTLTYSTANGTATAPSDYVAAASATATIPAGSLSTTLSIPTTLQTVLTEKDFTLSVVPTPGRVVGSPSATATMVPATFSYDLTSSLPAEISFSRASTATYIDTNGVMQDSPLNSPRFDHDASGSALGLLVEEARTNLLPYSEQFETWNAGNVTLTPDIGTDIRGTVTADHMLETAVNGSHTLVIDVPNMPLNVVNTFSMYIKSDGRNIMDVQLTDTTRSVWGSARLNIGELYTYTTGGGSQAAGSITPAGNGWYRISISGNINGAANGTMRIYLFSVDDTTSFNFTGDPAKGFYLWGAQVETGTGATSYIPTTASPVTRAADVADMASVSWYHPSDGTYVIKTQFPTGSGNQTLFSSDNGTGSEMIYANYNTSTVNLGYEVLSGGAVQASSAYLNWVATPFSRSLALSYKANSFGVALEGWIADAKTSGNVPTAPTNVRLGRSYNDSNYLNGHISWFQYFTHALTQSSIKLLTN